MELLICRNVLRKRPEKQNPMSKHLDLRSQISHYGWMQLTYMRSVSFWGKLLQEAVSAPAVAIHFNFFFYRFNVSSIAIANLKGRYGHKCGAPIIGLVPISRRETDCKQCYIKKRVPSLFNPFFEVLEGNLRKNE